VTAYTLGLRHAFDADHIAAIDNTTRKLMADGKRPLSVGFFFSLGHSTVVFVLALLLASASRRSRAGRGRRLDAARRAPARRDRRLRDVPLRDRRAEPRGPRRDRARVPRDAPRRLRRGRARGAARRARPDEPLPRRVTRAIRAPWQMYPLGILFGSGFDTATEVALLFLAGGAAGAGLPWYAILCLPSCSPPGCRCSTRSTARS
jgi:high-affinity nickel-transport protein